MTEVLTAPEVPEVLSHTKTRSSGILVETKTDNVNALHTVCERIGGGFDYYRYDRGSNQWTGPFPSSGSKGNVKGPVVYLGSDNKIDVLYREIANNVGAGDRDPGKLCHTYSGDMQSSSNYPWQQDIWELRDAKDVCGAPAVCRWWFGDSGTEMIAPVTGGGFRHWYRNGPGHWYMTVNKYPNQFVGLAMVLGPGKWLYVAAVENDGTLWAIHRDGSQNWHSKNLGRAFTGQPALVESGRRDNVPYDLVVPNAGGGLIHYEVSSWFNQTEAARFGDPKRVYGQIGMVYNYANQLEVVARPADGGPLEHYINRFDGKGWVAGMPFPIPIAKGSWEVKYDLKAIGIHTILLRTNEIATYGLSDEDEHHAVGSFLGLASGKVVPMTQPMPHIFCCGQAQLPNGDLLIASGHTNSENQLLKMSLINGAYQFVKLPDLHRGRWYPTVTTLNDGKMLIIAGAYRAGSPTGLNNSYEIFDPKDENNPRKRIELWDEIGENFSADCKQIDMYPFVFVLPNQRIFVHSRYSTRFFDYPKSGKGSWSGRMDAILKSPRTYCYQGTSVLLPLHANGNNDYPSATVAVFGGAGSKDAGIDTPATKTIEIMTTDAPAPKWEDGGNLITERVMPDSVLLPDGKVLIVNGSRTGRGDGNMSRQPVLSAEIYDPETKKCEEVASMRVPRLYHAAAVLLPDARVLVTGKCKYYNRHPYKYPEHRGEVYTPDYLLTGKARPKIAAAPATIASAGASYNVTVSEVGAADIKSVMLIRLGAATHSFNMDQRAVSVPFTAAADKVTFTAPKTNWVVPPGYYMLFVVSKDGVPSEAKFVRVAVF